jgi:cytochrome c oxidase subunit 4
MSGKRHPAGDEFTHYAHIVPAGVLTGVFAALLALTYLTVAATWYDLGQLNFWAAIGIATVKAALVALYFMHLRYDHPFNAVVLLAALLFLFIFVSLALLDSTVYQPDIRAWQEANPR